MFAAISTLMRISHRAFWVDLLDPERLNTWRVNRDNGAQVQASATPEQQVDRSS